MQHLAGLAVLLLGVGALGLGWVWNRRVVGYNRWVSGTALRNGRVNEGEITDLRQLSEVVTRWFGTVFFGLGGITFALAGIRLLL